MLDVSRLRCELPSYDTPELEKEWRSALAVLTEIDELEIPCAMSVGTRRVLFQVVRAMGAKNVLDIGTYTGTSAVTYALAVGEGGRVTTVDIQEANAEGGHWMTAGRPRNPARLMHDAGVMDRVRFITQDSVEYLKETEDLFDFISIDGWHEDFAVYAEIEWALQRLKPDGLIFLDDVQVSGYDVPPGHDTITGPWQALQRHLEAHAPFRVNLLTRSLEGEPMACAILTRVT